MVKKNFLFALAALVVMEANAVGFKTLSMAEGIEMAKGNPKAVIVDVRRDDEYKAGHNIVNCLIAYEQEYPQDNMGYASAGVGHIVLILLNKQVKKAVGLGHIVHVGNVIGKHRCQKLKNGNRHKGHQHNYIKNSFSSCLRHLFSSHRTY